MSETDTFSFSAVALLAAPAGKPKMGRMRFGDHDDWDDWAARVGIPPTPGANSALPARVRALVNEAIDIIWAFYKRPLEDDVRWAMPEHAENLAAFRSACISRDDYLIELCRDLRGHDNLEAYDSGVLAVLVDIADVVRGGTWNMQGGIAREEEGCSFPPPHDVTTAYAVQAESPGLRADFRIDQVQHRVKLRNLSPEGVMIIDAPHSCDGKAGVIGIRGRAWVEGKVVWSLDDRCGFAFADKGDPLVEFMRKLFVQGHLDY